MLFSRAWRIAINAPSAFYRGWRNHPDSIVISEIVSGFYFAGGQPVITQRQIQYGGGIINREGNRFMGNYIRVVITNQSNTQGSS